VDAVQISVVRTQRVLGTEEITHLGTALSAGTRWFTLDEVIEAIERGERFYVQAGAESMLISVHHDGDGSKTLRVGFDAGLGRLLTLLRHQ
jgi:hypothetical protein